MSKKISFPEPSCRYHCPHFKSVGPSLNETHYCMKKGKNGKRFSKKDSKRKPPAWCPLRLNSPICRIYGFRNELQEMLAFDEWLSIDPAKVGWYTNEGKTIHIPTISFFSASNEIPNFTNPEEKILKPLYDRFELKVVTEYVEDRAARLKILKQKQAAPHLAQAPAAPITLEELEAMQDDVRQVHILDSINELMDDVLCALREKGIHISDRKYFNYAPVAQAKAWLEGRDTVAPADLIILRHYLWTAPEERAIIQSALVQMCSDPFKNRLDGILAAAQESYQEFEDDSGAAPARRIGKLREEYLMLYEKLSAMRAEAQDDIGRQKVDACMEDLEAFNKKAFSEDGVSGVFSYVPLKELYLLKAN